MNRVSVHVCVRVCVNGMHYSVEIFPKNQGASNKTMRFTKDSVMITCYVIYRNLLLICGINYYSVEIFPKNQGASNKTMRFTKDSVMITCCVIYRNLLLICGINFNQ